jgi:DNA primase small subunit
VTGLLADLDGWEKSSEAVGNDKLADWEKTSLRPYIQYFKAYVAQAMRDEMRLKKEKDEAGGVRVDQMLDF